MYKSTHYIKIIVPKKRARDYVNMCATDNTFNADTTCSNAKDLLNNQTLSVGYMKLCVDRDLNCGWQLVT
jgi:hypothetical protein